MNTITAPFVEAIPSDATLMLLGEYGSVAHGVALDSSDHDYVGIAVEPQRMIMGLDYVGWDHWDTSVVKPRGDQARSEAEDHEGTVHALRKFVRLARQGNTAVLSALYLPSYVHLNEAGEHLLAHRDLFVSYDAVERFVSHLKNERGRMMGDEKAKVIRPELIEEYGYDTKAAYQAIKLAFYGLDYAENGSMSIPFTEPQREFILSVRRGEVPQEEVLDFLSASVDFLEQSVAHGTSLPRSTDKEKLNKLLYELYEMSW